MISYEDFIRAKIRLAEADGLEIQPGEVNELLKPHQRDIVLWAIRGGRRAIFAAFGLGKTFIQLEIARIISWTTKGRFLIVAPLGVRQEFIRDGQKLGIPVRFIRSIEECGAGAGVYITNYETVRDGNANNTNNGPKTFSKFRVDFRRATKARYSCRLATDTRLSAGYPTSLGDHLPVITLRFQDAKRTANRNKKDDGLGGQSPNSTPKAERISAVDTSEDFITPELGYFSETLTKRGKRRR